MSERLKDEAALRGRLTIKVAEAPELGGAAASLTDTLYSRAGALEADVLLTEAQQRLDVRPGAKDGFSTVHRGGDGLVFWDVATKSSITVPAEAMLAQAIQPARTLKVERKDEGQEVVIVLHTEDEALGVLRHEIVLTTDAKLAKFGPSMLRLLHCGPACHATSGLDWEMLAGAGLILRETTWREGQSEPLSRLALENLEHVAATPEDFLPPKDYRALLDIWKSAKPKPAPEPYPVGAGADPDVGVARMALKALRLKDRLTPDCLGGTRFGAVSATLHQDTLSLAASAINTLAPLIGNTTITAAGWAIPWLGNLAGVAPAAPGAGLSSFLRQPRVTAAASTTGMATGGLGLLDCLAFKALTDVNAVGLTRTQREFAAGTLLTTLAGWGLPAPAVANASANLFAASGALTGVSRDDQILIVEGFETMELGTPTVPFPAFVASGFAWGSITVLGFVTPPIFTVSIAGVAGTVNFGAIAGPLVPTAAIGGSGNILLGITLPPIALAATITRSFTPWGRLVVGAGSVGLCFIVPVLCPFVLTLLTIAAFLGSNVTSLTAAAPALGLTYDITFDYDPSTERVEPFVTMTALTGGVTITNTWVTPNLIANVVESLILGLGNLTNTWAMLLGEAIAGGLEKAMRGGGLQLPVAGAQQELTAVSGGALSTSGGILELFADLKPRDDVTAHPFITQTPTNNVVRQNLVTAHLDMRRDLNPQPVPAPALPVLSVGTFAAMGISQNALNAYVFAQWLAGRFEVAVTDPAIIAAFTSIAPQLFGRQPNRVHIWPSGPPRVEIATGEVAQGRGRPLLVWFDDVRICFEAPHLPGNTDGLSFGGWELACNFRLAGTVNLGWPWVFSVWLDPPRHSIADVEPRSWEFVDLNAPNVMGAIQAVDLAKMVDLAAGLIAAQASAIALRPPRPPISPWTRRMPATQQVVFPEPMLSSLLTPQRVYVELETHHKTLYVLPAIQMVLLEFFDGSGAPSLPLFLGVASAPTPFPATVMGMRAAHGAALRNYLIPMLGLPIGP